jgi:uncharacterized OsmC-like protein
MSTPIREAIEKLSASFSAEPARARAKNAPATAKLTEGLQCEVTGPYSARIVTDMPPAMGGAASGPNPGWFLRAALASCTTTAIAMRAAKLGIKLDVLEFTVESESDTRGLLGLDDRISAGLSAIRCKVKISGSASREALQDLVAWGDAHSPVGCTLRQVADCSLAVEVV